MKRNIPYISLHILSFIFYLFFVHNLNFFFHCARLISLSWRKCKGDIVGAGRGQPDVYVLVVVIAAVAVAVAAAVVVALVVEVVVAIAAATAVVVLW